MVDILSIAKRDGFFCTPGIMEYADMDTITLLDKDQVFGFCEFGNGLRHCIYSHTVGTEIPKEIKAFTFIQNHIGGPRKFFVCQKYPIKNRKNFVILCGDKKCQCK